MKSTAKTFATGLLLVVIQPLFGETVETTVNSNLYQVEVIIFLNDQDKNENSETWNLHYDLSYPCNYIIAAKEKSAIGNLSIANQKVQESVSTITQIIPHSPLHQFIAEDESLRSTKEEIDSDIPNLHVVRKFERFRFLTDKFYSLWEIKNKLVSNNYRVVFHEAWAQRLTRADRPLSIVVDSNPDSQIRSEIQGTVSLNMNRFIHFTTNIWRNIYDQRLSDISIKNLPPFVPNPIRNLRHEKLNCFNSEMSIESPVFEQAYARKPIMTRYSDMERRSLYPWSYAVPLRQSQKVKLSQIHYLDHPLMGVIVKIELKNRASEKQLL